MPKASRIAEPALPEAHTVIVQAMWEFVREKIGPSRFDQWIAAHPKLGRELAAVFVKGLGGNSAARARLQTLLETMARG